MSTTTPEYGLPLPPNSTLIATFPKMLRDQSTQLEQLLPGAMDRAASVYVPAEIRRQGTPYVIKATEAAAAAAAAQDTARGFREELAPQVAALNTAAGYAPGDPTDAAVAALAAQPASQYRAAEDPAIARVATAAAEDTMGLVLAGKAFDAARLQTAADRAAAEGKRLWAAGTLTTAQTLVLHCDMDLGGLTINYTGPGTAVELGDITGTTFRLAGTTPRVVNAGAWAENAGTIGIRMINVNTSTLTIPYVRGFGVGVQLYGAGTGVVYNTVTVGHLDNNRTNLQLDRDAAGWANENIFIGGRYSHNSANGDRVPGTAHIDLVERPVNSINNNLWLKPSIEGNVAEYHAKISGAYNVIQSGRWESSLGPRVRWMGTAQFNALRDGYQVHMVEESWEGTANPTNQVTGNQQRLADYNRPALVLENTNGGAVAVVHAPGTRKAGRAGYNVAHLAENWLVQLSHRFMMGKQATDTRERLLINWETGAISFGPGGTTGPGVRFGINATDASTAELTGANLRMQNGYAIGLPAIADRPGYVRARYATVTGAHTTANRPSAGAAGAGAMIFDTTQNKPLWSTGSAWVDATGATA